MKKMWKALGDIFFEAEEEDEEDVIVQEVDPAELEEIPFVQMPVELKKTDAVVPPIHVASTPIPTEEPAENADIPFTVPSVKTNVEPVVAPVEKPVMPVMPAPEKKAYEFTRVISPTAGWKDAGTESPKVVIPSVKPSGAIISPTGMILSPIKGNFPTSEIMGDDVEPEIAQMRPEDFLLETGMEEPVEEPEEEPEEPVVVRKPAYTDMDVRPTRVALHRQAEFEDAIQNMSLFDDEFK